MTQIQTTEYNNSIIIPMEDITVATKLNLSEEAYQRKIDRNIKYNATKTKRIPLDLNLNTDADILAYLETVPNKQGLVKQLLRASMLADGFVYKPEEQNEKG